MPFFTIVTINLNNLSGLISTHKSIVNQTCDDFEWVVIDGFSDDGSINYLRSAADGNLRWSSSRDLGIYDAMNKGILMGEGLYTVFMNSGDIFYSSSTLSMVYQALDESSSDLDLLFGGAVLYFGKSRSYLRRPIIAHRIIWHGLPANHQATYYRSALLRSYPFDLRYKICGDYYSVAVMILNGAKSICLNIPLVIYDTSGKSSRDMVKLFSEPYYIQTNILRLSIYLRLLSLCRRALATVVFQAFRFFSW